jgi:CRP-like cAMP-binding protein
LAQSPLLSRLSFYADLSERAEKKLRELPGTISQFQRKDDIITSGENLDTLLIVNHGWAIRYKSLEDGRRQVLNVLLPGDIFDLQVFVAAEADHSVQAVTEMECFAVQPEDFQKLLTDSPTLTLAFWWTQVQEEAFLREQIVRNGRQTARERIGNFLLELHRRLRIVHEGEVDCFRMPLSQTLIGDALGLTPIHTNRVLRQLEHEELIERGKGWIVFKDREKLAEICQFDPAYFHEDAFRRRFVRSI